MKPIRYALLALLTLAPSLAAAQFPTTDVTLIGEDVLGPYVALGALFGEPFLTKIDIGPADLVVVESEPTGEFPDAPPDEGCNPYTPESAAEVAGNIAFIQRGVCPFVVKAQHAAAAGAIAYVVYNDERVPDYDETIVSMSGECTPDEGCSVPGAFISRASAIDIIDYPAFSPTFMIDTGYGAIPPKSVTIDNGMVLTTLFPDGFIGKHPTFGFGDGFTFEGENGLFVSSVLVGVDGAVTSNPYDGESEFTRVENALRLLSPSEIPSPFDVGATSQFTSPLGFLVTLSGYADADEPNTDFVIFDLAVENTSGADIEDVYLGLFADWDTGTTTSTDDAGGVAPDLNLAYVFDPVEAGPYFGVAAVGVHGGPALSGYSTDATTADDAQLFEALTTAVAPGAEPMERAAVVGVGPYDIAAGATEYVLFAFVAGADEADFFANAQAAQLPIATSAVEDATPEGPFALGAAYPNPAAGRTAIPFTLPTAQRVRLAVYDVLGREVAVLVDGARAAGAQTVAFDAAALPSGVYLYRLEAGGAVLTRRLTLVR